MMAPSTNYYRSNTGYYNQPVYHRTSAIRGAVSLAQSLASRSRWNSTTTAATVSSPRASVSSPRASIRRHEKTPEKHVDRYDRVNIECLPEEIMLDILKLLGPEELAQSVIPVCQRWRRLGKDESLWSQASLRYGPESESDGAHSFVRAVLSAPILDSVEVVSDEKKMREEVVSSLAHGCARIRSLTLLPWYVSHKSLRSVLEHCAQHLTYLEILLPDLNVLGPISYMDNLRSLVLHGEVSYVSDMMLKLAEGCQQLECLDLGGLRFTDVYRLDQLLEAVVRGHSERLTTLKLPPTLTSTLVLSAVASCAKLRVFSVWITPNIGAQELMKTVENLNLISLTWRNYDAVLDGGELAQFILYSDKFLQLEEFRLVDCIDVDNAIATAISYRCENLKKLSLHRSEMTPEGLLEILSKAEQLVELDVYKNTFFTLEHLETLPVHARNLTLLDIRGCSSMRSVTATTWRRIRSQLPALKIRFD